MTLYRIDREAQGESLHPVIDMQIDLWIAAEILIPVVLDPTIGWCFAHDNSVFLDLDISELICARHLRGPCDIADAAVIRIGDET